MGLQIQSTVLVTLLQQGGQWVHQALKTLEFQFADNLAKLSSIRSIGACKIENPGAERHWLQMAALPAGFRAGERHSSSRWERKGSLETGNKPGTRG